MLKKIKAIMLCSAAVFAAGVFLLSGCAKSGTGLPAVDDDTKAKIVDVDYIYNNIIVNYINIGGLTKEQAKAVLNEKLQAPLEDSKISFINPYTNETVKECSYIDFGLQYEIDALVEEAYEYGRTGTLDERYQIVTQLVQQSKTFEYFDRYSYDEEKVNEIVDEIAQAVYKAPTEPKAEMNGSKAVITESGKDGWEVDKDKLTLTLTGLLDDISYSKEGDDIYLPINTVSPTCSEEDIAKINSTLGSFSTKYTGSLSQGRNTNMNVAASKINGVVLMPGEVFSTNDHFGSSTASNGYVNAPVIVNGELEDGIGGGVCQVSSTLYNAVLYSELDVVERQNHSLKVGYADYGFDATLADNAIDFKFKNSTDAPIIIESYLANNRVYCTIYGHDTRPSSRTLKFENELVSSTDTSVKYDVYKLVYENGVLQDRVKVNTSTYKIKTNSEQTTETTTQMQEETVAQTETRAVTLKESEPAQVSVPVQEETSAPVGETVSEETTVFTESEEEIPDEPIIY